MADLLPGEVSRPQLLPAEQQRVGHLSKRVQVEEPHPALKEEVRIRVQLPSGKRADHAASWGEYLAVSVDIEHNCKGILWG